MERLTDKELVIEFTTDKEKAFRIFFDTYYLRLCMYAVQITDDFSESEDIVQGFFIQFWEKELYKTVTVNLKNYAYLCVRNAALKYIEKRERIPFDQILISDEYLYAYEEMDHSEREAKERELKKALDELPEQERNALYRVVIENQKYKDAADELHISVNTLKSYLSRALKRLRKNDKLMLLSLFCVDRTMNLF